MVKKNISVFMVINLAAISAPIFLAGCGSSAPATSAQVIAATNSTGTSTSGTSSSGSSSSGTSSTGSSGSGTSNSGNSNSGTSTSGTSSSGTSSSGTSSSGTSSSGSSTTGSSGSGTSGSGSSGGADQVPASALAVSKIQTLTNWDSTYDTATGTSSSDSTGQMSLTGTPSRSGSARQFVTDYTNAGGERYWVSFGADTASTHFFYDGWIYIAKPSTDIANLELDMNQVMSNGQTVIYGFQCDGYSSTWDYTKNAGTPDKPKGEWVHTTAACNPRNWSTDTWHHVQIEYSRDDVGNVTYQAVWLDGTEQDINETVPSASALGWGSTLLTNFQVDGLGASGKATVYLDDLTISRW